MIGRRQLGEGVNRQSLRRPGAEPGRRRLAGQAGEHGEVAGAGSAGQWVLEGAFQPLVMRVVEDVINERTGARPLDRDRDLEADQLQ